MLLTVGKGLQNLLVDSVRLSIKCVRFCVHESGGPLFTCRALSMDSLPENGELYDVLKYDSLSMQASLLITHTAAKPVHVG